MRKSEQLGEGRVGFIVTLVLFVSLAFVGYKVLPVRINAYQFREALREEARYASVNRNDKQVAERILQQATQLNIPLDPDDVAAGVDTVVEAALEWIESERTASES